MDIFIISSLTLLGLVFGSFAGAQVWRLRARQLMQDKKSGEDYDKAEYTRLKPLIVKKGAGHDRSKCLGCGHKLHWVDMLPVVSWVSLRGKCRYCKRSIGWFEPLMELLMAGLFVGSYLLWPLELVTAAQIGVFALWLVAILLLVILATYDYKWQLLPDVINFTFIAFAAVFLASKATVFPGEVQALSVLGSVGILSGLYAVLYKASGGAWIGFGDVKLGLGLGLLLGDWKLAFLGLFLANLIGTLLVIPGILRRALNSKSHIAFGPLLIVGALIAFFWGQPFIKWLFSGNMFFM